MPLKDYFQTDNSETLKSEILGRSLTILSNSQNSEKSYRNN